MKLTELEMSSFKQKSFYIEISFKECQLLGTSIARLQFCLSFFKKMSFELEMIMKFLALTLGEMP